MMLASSSVKELSSLKHLRCKAQCDTPINMYRTTHLSVMMQPSGWVRGEDGSGVQGRGGGWKTLPTLVDWFVVWLVE